MARAKTPAAAGGLRRFGPLAKLVTASLMIAMFVVAFELFLRIPGLVTGMPYYAYDVGTGPRVAPNQSGRYMRGQWVSGWYRYNAQGWNHPEDYVVAKPPGTTRIAMVGDSQVAAQQVDVNETMFLRAQRSMSAAGRPTEWYAFGVAGYGTAQELEIVRHHALKYSPDVVVLMFVANDPYDTSPYLVDIEPYYPRYVLDGQGDLLRLPQSTWSFPWWKREITQTALFRYFSAQKGIGAKLRHLRNPGVNPVFGGLPLRADVGTYKNLPIEELAAMTLLERQQKTWQLIERLLREMRDECRKRGAKLAIVYRGWAAEIEAPIAPETVDAVAKEADPFCLGPRAREMGREQVAPIAARLEIPYLDLTFALRAAVANSGKSHHFPDDKHFSMVGHEAAGEALAKWVTDLLAHPDAAKPGN